MRQKINVAKRRKIRSEFKRFRELCPDLPLGKPHFFDGTKYDPPDVCIGNGELGIEFTDFVRGAKGSGGSAQKANEEFLGEVVREARERFEQEKQIPLWVSFHWQNYTHQKKVRKQTLVSDLVKVIDRSLSNVERIEIGWDEFEGTSLETYLAAMSILRLDTPLPGTWTNFLSGRVDVGLNDLEPLIREKERDLPRYEHRFKSVWLVIVASIESPSSDSIPDPTLTAGYVTSKFDRVYLLNTRNPVFVTNPHLLGAPLICLTADKN